LILRGKPGELTDHFLPVFFHFLLLHRISDQDCLRRKGGFAGGVLWMEVCGSEKELCVVRCKFRRYTCDDGSIFWTQSCIDDKCRMGADDDCDVGETQDRSDVVGNSCGVLAHHRLAHLCKRTGGPEQGYGQNCRE